MYTVQTSIGEELGQLRAGSVREIRPTFRAVHSAFAAADHVGESVDCSIRQAQQRPPSCTSWICLGRVVGSVGDSQQKRYRFPGDRSMRSTGSISSNFSRLQRSRRKLIRSSCRGCPNTIR